MNGCWKLIPIWATASLQDGVKESIPYNFADGMYYGDESEDMRMEKLASIRAWWS